MCWQVEKEDKEFEEEFLSKADPSIMHFLLASGEQVRAAMLLSPFHMCPFKFSWLGVVCGGLNSYHT